MRIRSEHMFKLTTLSPVASATVRFVAVVLLLLVNCLLLFTMFFVFSWSYSPDLLSKMISCVTSLILDTKRYFMH